MQVSLLYSTVKSCTEMAAGHFVVVLLALGLAQGRPAEDEIVSLPGLDFPINFLQYSGYLNGSEGNKLHYWFTESSRPSETPLILWLNGGPGCSSVDGMLSENGPFIIKKDGSGFQENPYAWNTVGNVLFLESPACVGYSYNENGSCDTSDDETAESNYLALQHFFAKFPEYRTTDFYITGESYAGIYIPTLAVKIVQNNATYPMNLKGFAIGNGVTTFSSIQGSLMFFGRYHSILENSLWTDLVNRCCGGVESQNICDFYSANLSAPCVASVVEATDILYYRGLNVYNIYKDCETPIISKRTRGFYDLKNMLSHSRINLNETLVFNDCIDEEAETNYMNDPAVRDALHIPSNVQAWAACSDEVAGVYETTVFNTSSLLNTLRDNGVRGVLYNGDVDSICNFLGNQWDIQDLGYPVVEERRQWTLGGQVAGYVTKYELLDFVTVRGSGHMVPTDKPAEALKMLSSFIDNVPY